MVQTKWVVSTLEKLHPDLSFEISWVIFVSFFKIAF